MGLSNVLALVLSTVAILVSGASAVRQITMLRHANQLPVIVDLLREFRSESFQKAQDYVVHRLGAEYPEPVCLSDLSYEARLAASTVRSFFSGLGAMVSEGIADERTVVSVLGYRADRAWSALEPFILKEREARGDAHYAAFFEDLVARTRKNWPPEEHYGLKLRKLT